MAPRRAARGREEVLLGAGRVIARRGADATRFADVAAETGSAISTLQYSFGNREDMILAALHHTNAEDLRRVENAIAGIEDPIERLLRFVETTLRSDADTAEARESWLTWVEYWRAAARDEDVARQWHTVYEEWKQLLRPILTDGIEAGAFQIADVDAAAAQVLALFDGLSVPMVLGNPAMPLKVLTRLALSGVAALVGCAALQPATR